MRLAAVLVVVLWSVPAHAQEPHQVVYAGAMVADWASTLYMLETHPGIHERNPLVSWAEDRPVLMVSVGAAMDLTAIWLVHRFVKPNHPTLVRVLAYVLGAVRIGMAIHNVRLAR